MADLLRIAGLEVVPYALPFREPYVTARGSLERREIVLLRLRTEEGIEGLGEAVPLGLRGGTPLTEIERELRDRVAEALLGASVEDAEPPSGLSPPARAAVEMALLDLRGKAVGEPVWKLLGAGAARPVPCNATLTVADPPLVAAQAERWAGRGFTTFKLKVGVAGDVVQVAAVRDVLGDQARLRVDANGAWSPAEAVTKLSAMERNGIELAEQPAADLEDLALIRGQTAIPIAADESVTNVDDARRAIELGACQLATVKLAKCGGIGPALAVARDLPAYLSSALDGPVGIAAAGHAAQGLRDAGDDAGVAHGLATQFLFSATIASVESAVGDGLLEVPDGPGLGVELDEQALARHRL